MLVFVKRERSRFGNLKVMDTGEIVGYNYRYLPNSFKKFLWTALGNQKIQILINLIMYYLVQQIPSATRQRDKSSPPNQYRGSLM